MPELPDVEGFKRVLTKNGLRKKISRVTVSDVRILGKLSAQTFVSRLQGTSSLPPAAMESTSWRMSIEGAG
jgi:formamidopyrimidine-DNA glycosylase